MSFDSREFSLANAQPVRLYRFSRGALEWRYNTSDRAITHDGQVYETVLGGISDNGIRMSGDPQADMLIIMGPADLSVAELFRGSAPSDSIDLVVFDTHYSEPEARLSWRGSIASVDWPTLNSCRISCQSMDVQMQQPGLTMTYSRGCTAVLGDGRCKVNLSTLRQVITDQAVDSVKITSGTVAQFYDDWFTGGYVEWPVGGGQFDRRHIERHTGSQLVMLGGTWGVPATGELRVYPGCDFLIGTCANKFNNTANFRGIPHLQGSSPFDGDSPF